MLKTNGILMELIQECGRIPAATIDNIGEFQALLAKNGFISFLSSCTDFLVIERDWDRLLEHYKSWLEISLEMLASGIPGSVDCGEGIVREGFSNFCEFDPDMEISFPDMFELERSFDISGL